jgi:hypothetical protein
MKQDIACPHCSAGSLLPILRMTAADIKETMHGKLVLCIHRKLTPNVGVRERAVLFQGQ